MSSKAQMFRDSQLCLPHGWLYPEADPPHGHGWQPVGVGLHLSLFPSSGIEKMFSEILLQKPESFILKSFH